MQRMIAVALAMALAVTSGIFAAQTLTLFAGAAPTDLTRGIPRSAFAPKFMPEREYIDSYSFWIQLDDGTSIIGGLLLTNLGRKNASMVEATIYPPAGTPVHATNEYPPDAFRFTSDRVQMGPNSLERLPGERYRVRLNLPIASGGGRTLVADLSFDPDLPGFSRGDGQLRFGNDGRRFELALLAPRSRLEGHYAIDDRVQSARGTAYLDHAAQNLWSHHIADRWFNYRFFSKDLFVACSSGVAPARYGSTPFAHVLVAGRDRLLLSTDRQDLRLINPVVDPESGYAIPREVQVRIDGAPVRLEFVVPTPRFLDRIYVLQELNVFLRAAIRALVSTPYSYRYRAQVQAKATWPDGTTTKVPGTFLAEMYRIND